MSEEKMITGMDENEVWQQLNNDLKDPDLIHYKAAIKQGNIPLLLDIDIDPGGGFESGYATTTLTAPLQTNDGFKFAIHPQHFIDTVGKFLGMQDVIIGYPEFDEKFIIKTNDAVRLKALFGDNEIREILSALPDFTFEIQQDETGESSPALQLLIEEAITDPASLRSVYHAFYQVLAAV